MLQKLYVATRHDSIRMKALEVIGTESDPKYRKEYAGEWKGA